MKVLRVLPLCVLILLTLARGALAQTTATYGEAAIGTACGSLANGFDFDTAFQCNTSDVSGGLKQKAPLFVGQVTSPPYTDTTCDSSKAGMMQYASSTMQYCNGSSWISILASSGYLGTSASLTGPSRSDDVTTGLFSATASTVSIATAGTERLTVTATGSVGIGTTTPAYRLDVNGSVRTNAEIIGNGLGGYGQFRMIQGNYGSLFRNDGSDTYLLLTNSGDQYGSWNTLRPFTVHNASGRVSISTNLYINATGGVATPLGLSYNGASNWMVGPDVNNSFVIFNASGVGMYIVNGAQSWTASSDRRLKENIETVRVLDKLEKYRAVEFDWKKTGKHDLGVIAQELYPIFPQLVDKGSEDPDASVEMGQRGTWGVMYDRLGALALEGVKELYAILKLEAANREANTQAILDLREENVQLRARLEAVESVLKRQSRNP